MLVVVLSCEMSEQGRSDTMTVGGLHVLWQPPSSVGLNDPLEYLNRTFYEDLE